MKPNRITLALALALALAGLAAPAFAEKCVGSCDFNDEPLIVTPTKKSSGTAAGLTAAPAVPTARSVPNVSEILITKTSDIASEPLMSSQHGRPLEGLSRTPLDRGAPAPGSVHRHGYVSPHMLDQGLRPAPVVPLASPAIPPARSGFNYSKVELYVPPKNGAPNTPAAMGVRR